MKIAKDKDIYCCTTLGYGSNLHFGLSAIFENEKLNYLLSVQFLMRFSLQYLCLQSVTAHGERNLGYFYKFQLYNGKFIYFGVFLWLIYHLCCIKLLFQEGRMCSVLYHSVYDWKSLFLAPTMNDAVVTLVVSNWCGWEGVGIVKLSNVSPGMPGAMFSANYSRSLRVLSRGLSRLLTPFQNIVCIYIYIYLYKYFRQVFISPWFLFDRCRHV